jgi:hypothetical protein
VYGQCYTSTALLFGRVTFLPLDALFTRVLCLKTMRATRPVHISLLNVITLTVLDVQCKSLAPTYVYLLHLYGDCGFESWHDNKNGRITYIPSRAL